MRPALLLVLVSGCAVEPGASMDGGVDSSGEQNGDAATPFSVDMRIVSLCAERVDVVAGESTLAEDLAPGEVMASFTAKVAPGDLEVRRHGEKTLLAKAR